MLSTGWNFIENSNKFMLQYAQSQDLIFVAMLPNKFENQFQIICNPSLSSQIRQVYQFVDQGMMTTGQPSGLSPEGAMSNTDLEMSGHDYTFEFKKLKSQFQSA